MLDPDKGAYAYAYDAANRLTAFTDPEGKVTSYSYDTLGRVVDTKLANNSGTTNSYDDDNRLAGMVTSSDRDGVLASFQYTYDGEGNKLTMTEEDGGVTSYQYDAVYRLIRVDYPERPGQKVIPHKNNGSDQGKGKKKGHCKDEPPLPASVSYVYDAAGNRLSEDNGSKTISYRYNAANQLLQAGDVRYAYDANGNRISEQDGSGSKKYQYNADNFLVRFADPEGQATAMMPLIAGLQEHR